MRRGTHKSRTAKNVGVTSVDLQPCQNKHGRDWSFEAWWAIFCSWWPKQCYLLLCKHALFDAHFSQRWNCRTEEFGPKTRSRFHFVVRFMLGTFWSLRLSTEYYHFSGVIPHEKTFRRFLKKGCIPNFNVAGTARSLNRQVAKLSNLKLSYVLIV